MGIEIPKGQNVGNTVTIWATSLHMATVGGSIWRICVSLVGLAIKALSITGVMIFMRRRRSRHIPLRNPPTSASASAI